MTFTFIILAETSTNDWGIKILVGIIGGVVATFLGFLLNQYHQDNKEMIKELKEYIAALQSAANELEFYGGILVQLSNELDAIVKRLEKWETSWIIPTYSIYPDFLEKCKATISEFHKNPKLVKEVGRCHFELCHITARLDFLKREMNEPMDRNNLNHELKTRLLNVGGFKLLVDENISRFKKAQEEIVSERTDMDRELQLKKERSLIPD